LPASGTYYVHVTGANTLNYSVAVIKNAELNIEPNDDQSNSQLVLSRLTLGKQYVLGRLDIVAADFNEGKDVLDSYRTSLPAKAALTAQPITPWTGAGEPADLLQPRIGGFTTAGVCACNYSSPSSISFTNGDTADVMDVQVRGGDVIEWETGDYI